MSKIIAINVSEEQLNSVMEQLKSVLTEDVVKTIKVTNEEPTLVTEVILYNKDSNERVWSMYIKGNHEYDRIHFETIKYMNAKFEEDEDFAWDSDDMHNAIEENYEIVYPDERFRIVEEVELYF